MATELKAPLEFGIHMLEDNERSLENNAQSNASRLARKESSSTQDTHLPKSDILQLFNTLAESIKLSSSSKMRADKSRQEAEWRARVHQRHIKHRETFPILFEETEFRAGKAEQIHQGIEDEADRAQKRQENAILALASTLHRIPPAANGGYHGDGDADIVSLRADVQATKESVMETAATEIASLRADVRNTNESLENARREIDHVNCNALTDQILEVRLQQSLKGLVPWKAHEAVQTKFTELTLESNSRKVELARIHKLVESVMSEIKQWSSLIEKHETKLGALTDDVGNETAGLTALENSLQELGNKVSGNNSSVQTRLDIVASKGEKQDKDLETFRSMVDEMKSRFQDVEANVKTLDMSQDSGHSQPQQAHNSCVSLTDLATTKQKFEDCNEKLLQTIREEQSVVTETFMQETQETITKQEQYAKELAELRSDRTAFRKALEDISKRHSVSQNPKPMNNPGDVPMRQIATKLENLGAEIKNVAAKNTALEHETRAIEQFVLNQQQKFDGLTTTQLTHNMINAIAQMYPSHPAHMATQINQLAANHRAVEGTVRLLSDRYAAVDNMVKNRLVAELQPISDKIRDFSSSQSKIRQDCTERYDGIATEVASVKAQTQSDFAKVTSEVSGMLSDVRQLKLRPPVASNPPSAESGIVSNSAAAAPRGSDETRASGLDSETPIQAHNRSAPVVPSIDTSINGNGKRGRNVVVDSSDEDAPLSAVMIKRNKQIRRLNKSSGGMP